MANYTNHPSQSINDRFWLKVDKRKRNECWWWKASIDVNGYGQFGMWKTQSDGKKTWTMAKAHRVAWLLTHGDIPPGIYLCHTCDMPRCVNPAHLFLGTQTDNMRDCVAKNRHGFGRTGQPIYYNIERLEKIFAAYKSGMSLPEITRLYEISASHLQKTLKRHKMPRRPREDANRKLTDTEITQIRELYAMGNVTQTALAERFGVTQSNIGYIVRGSSWPRLPINSAPTVNQQKHRRKLTTDQVLEIRRLWTSGKGTQTELAEWLGVHNSTIHHAIFKRKI